MLQAIKPALAGGIRFETEKPALGKPKASEGPMKTMGLIITAIKAPTSGHYLIENGC
jgi:hypothetical protein